MKYPSILFFILLTTFSTSLLAAGLREMNSPAEPHEESLIAIIGSRLVDGLGGAPIENAVVIVKGSEIIAAGSEGSKEIPSTSTRIDARGMTLLPGLIDTHFHSRDSVERPVEFELQKGITSFRDPGHPFKYYVIPLLSGETLPRIFLCGGHLDGSPPVWPDQAIRVTDARHARNAVSDHVKRGASAIKVYFRLPLEHLTAACEAADVEGVPVVAHLELVDADDAIRAGVSGIEHVTSFGTALAEPEDVERFKSEVSADSAARKPLRPWLWSQINLDQNPRLQPLLNLIVETGTFVSPTLAIYEARKGGGRTTPEQVDGFANMMQFISHCHAAGAKIVVGSHTRAPYADEGYAYLRELELLVQAGMSPMEALTAATRNGAEYLGIEDRLGTVEAGKTADLVLIKGDPTKDISDMRNVERVLLNGRWVYGGCR